MDSRKMRLGDDLGPSGQPPLLGSQGPLRPQGPPLAAAVAPGAAAAGAPVLPPLVPGPLWVTAEAVDVLKSMIQARGWDTTRAAALFSLHDGDATWKLNLVDAHGLTPGAYVAANCLGVIVAVPAHQAAQFHSRTLYAHRREDRRLFLWDEEGEGRSSASDPGQVALSHVKLRRLCPNLYDPPPAERSWCGLIIRQVARHLWRGDSRAALVATLAPLTVAAYSDDLDAVVLLHFPDELVKEYRLSPRQRLLCVNLYSRTGTRAEDILPGPAATTPWTNFYPLIADFFSDDRARVERRKAEIADGEWARAVEFTRAALRRRGGPRDGCYSSPMLVPPYWSRTPEAL